MVQYIHRRNLPFIAKPDQFNKSSRRKPIYICENNACIQCDVFLSQFLIAYYICQHCRTKTRVARLSVAQRIFIMNDHNKRHIIFHFIIHICPHVMFVQGSSRTPLQPTVTSLFLNTHNSDLQTKNRVMQSGD